jgi:hypothetical protein
LFLAYVVCSFHCLLLLFVHFCCSLLLFVLLTSMICFYYLFHLFLLHVLVDCFDCSLQLFVSTIFGLLLLLFVAKQWCSKLSPTPFPFDLCKFGRSFKLQSHIQLLSRFFQY